MKYIKAAVILGCAVFFASCSHTVSAPKEDDSATESSSNKKSDKSSSSKENNSSSSSAEELDEDCAGEPGNAWDGTTAKDFACGAGTKLSPYIILTAEQLAKLSFVTGASEKDYQGKYYKLGADIVLNEGEIIDDKGALVADSAKLHKWTPIGNSSVAFTGNFDGDGHTVSGMFINTTSTHNGLFGDNQGNISNLILKNSWVSGGNATGGVTGQNGGTIRASKNEATVHGSEKVGGIAGQSNGPYPQNAAIIASKNYGVIKGKNFVGGIVGHTYQASIDSCSNEGLVEGNNYVAGIAGKGAYNFVSSYLVNANLLTNNGEVLGKKYVGGIFGSCGNDACSSSYKCGTTLRLVNKGNIIGEERTGGVVGHFCAGTLKNVANHGNVEGKNYTAGIAGYIGVSSTENIYNLGNVAGSAYVGGVIGHNQEGVTSAAYSTGKVDGDSLVGLMIGYNYNTTMADYYYLEQGEQEPFGLNNGGGVATPKTSDEMKSEEFAELLGDDFVYDSELNDGYPILKWEEE